MSRLFSMLLFCLLVCSCVDDTEAVISDMMAHRVDIKLDEYEMYISSDTTYRDFTSIRDYALIVYFDSLDCMSCMVNKLHRWDEFIKDMQSRYERLKIIFMFEPKISELDNLKLSLSLENFHYPLFIDNKHVFSEKNNFIPNPSLTCYSCFLLLSSNLSCPSCVTVYYKLSFSIFIFLKGIFLYFKRS